MKTVVFSNGILTNPDLIFPEGTLIIAADGGARHCLESGIQPQVVIGDFDSLAEEEINTLSNAGSTLIPYPADKDETDLELALNYALENGATDITLIGLLGGRWDMSFANILLLASPRFSDIQFHIFDGKSEIFILRGNQSVDIHGTPGDIVSVIPISPEITGITYTNLEWPLENATLKVSSPRGVSNRLTTENATIKQDSGIALVFLIHK